VTSRISTRRRATMFATAAAFLASSLLSSGVVVAGSPGTPKSPNTKPVPEKTAVHPHAVSVDPAPIKIRPSSGSAASAPDPSIHLRQPSPRYAPPSVRTETPDKRTEHSRTYAEKDGSFTTELSEGRLNFKDAKGKWQPLDTDLVVDETDGYNLRVSANDVTVRFSDQDADSALASLGDGTNSFKVRAVGYGASAAHGSSRLSFPGSGPNGSVFVQPTDSGFEFGVTIEDRDRATSYHFALDTGGLTASLGADGRTILLNGLDPASGESVVAGAITAPALLDGNGAPAEPTTVTVKITGKGTQDSDGSIPPGALDGLGDHEILVTYKIDPNWLHDSARTFPITLDPNACIGGGVTTTCTINDPSVIPTSGGSFDGFIQSGYGDLYPTGWNVFRVGYDVRSGECGQCVYNTMRGMLYFSDVSLPDTAQVTSSTLALHVSSEYGSPASRTLTAYEINKTWSTVETWNQFGTGVTTTHASTGNDIPTSGTASLNVLAIVRDWYTRRSKDWKQNLGFQVRMSTESATYGEVEFDRYNDPTASFRPKLTINYYLPHITMDFAPELGSSYAPSQMTVGQVTKLPIVVYNAGSATAFGACAYPLTAASLCTDVGYRWFDAQGKLVSWGAQALPATLADNGNTGVFALMVTPPANPGQYTLRLDLVRREGTTTTVWFSDYAQPSKFYSRDKKALVADNTRWVGSSSIERDEFSLNVVSGGGTSSGELKTVSLGDGSSLGLNLGNKNVHYDGSGAIGFNDLGAMALRYGYDSANTASCTTTYQGILGACGWYTNFDERIVGGPNATGYDFVYQGPSGNRYFVDTDGSGQLTSGTPALLARPRVTSLDDTLPPGLTGVSLNPAQHFNGLYSASFTSGSDVGLAGTGFAPIDINTYRTLSFAVRTSAAAGIGIDFKVKDVDNGATTWLVYTVGADFTTCCTKIHLLNGASNYAVINTWASVTGRNIYQDARNSGIGGTYDDYQVISIQTTSNGTAGTAYLDAVRFEPGQTQIFAEAPYPTNFSSGQASTGSSSDAAVGSTSLKVTSAALASSPDCNTTAPAGNLCWSTSAGGLWAYPFAHWRWKKVGGSSVALEFHFKDIRTGTLASLVYYAGPTPPAGAPICSGSVPCAIQVSDHIPTEWTLVTRNILEDARQVLNFYNDNPAGSSAVPVQGPSPDDTQMTGFRLAGIDGNFALFDDLAYGSLPSVGSQLGAVAGDDFSATFADGSAHYFNRDGLLERIVDADGNTTTLDWSIPDLTKTGPGAYRLNTIHAPTDDATYTRQITVQKTTGSPFDTIAFKERLGSTTVGVTGRETDFLVANTAASAYGVGDLVKVNPARQTSATCASHPSGCAEFEYFDGTAHQLFRVDDPRWDGSTSGANDIRFEVAGWAAGGTGTPTAVLDRSHASAALLRVVSYDRATSTIYRRALWQSASMVAAGSAQHLDLTPEGQTVNEYAAQGPCASNDCVANPPAADNATVTPRKSVGHEFDGLTRVSKITTYRCTAVAIDGCTGTTPLASVTRQVSKAGAKVDNYNDPIGSNEIEWSQTAEQYFASLRDSNGTNPDLYRTEFAYDGGHHVIDTIKPFYNRVPSYADAVQSAYFLKAYWRLGEAAGATSAVDLSGNGYSAAKTGTVTFGSGGALARDPNTAASPDGATGFLSTSGTSMAVSGSFTIEGWAKPAVTTANMAVFGSRGPSEFGFDVKFVNDGKHVRVDLGTGAAWLVNQSLNFTYTAGRWYHLALSVGGGAWILYVDGKPIGSGSYSGTALLTNSTHNFYIGKNGLTTTPEWFNGAVDEVAIFGAALDSHRITAQYQAGRGVALNDEGSSYDREAHPLATDDQAFANGDFESGLTGYEAGGTSATTNLVTTSGDPTVNTGFGSLAITGSGYINQDAQLLPGQTARFQFAAKSSASTAHSTYVVYYWRVSTHSWDNLVGASYSIATSWTAHAWDVTVPLDSDGRVRVSFWDDGGAGTVYFDDLVLVTHWKKSDYLANGLVSDTYSFVPGDASGAFVRTQTTYAATTATPAVFATKTVANYVDGTPGPSPDQDATSTTAYDVFGRVAGTTDPDGVTSTTTYAANQTDVATTVDGAGGITSFSYDAVGNKLSTTMPAGETTTSVFDGLGHATRSTAADGAVSTTTFDTAGLPTRSIANYIDGTASNNGGDDDATATTTYDAFGRAKVVVKDAGVIGQTTTNAYDAVGNVTSNTITAAAGDDRTTSSYFATVVVGSTTYTQLKPSGFRSPIAPSTGGPQCPGAPAGTLCNAVSVLDMNGLPISASDGFAKVTITDSNFADQAVRSIANFVAGGPATADQNLTSQTIFDLDGHEVLSIDPAGHPTAKTYDPLGHRTTETKRDTATHAYSFTKTTYTPGGRPDLQSAQAAAGTPDSGLHWSRTLYDRAGRKVTTLANYDTSGSAQIQIDGFERGLSTRWSTTGDAFINPPASTGVDAYATTAPKNGTGRLRFTSTATTANNGTRIDLSNAGTAVSPLAQTFKQNHLYKLHVDVLAPAGHVLAAQIGVPGVDTSPPAQLTSSGVWQAFDLTWIPTADRPSSVAAEVRLSETFAASVYLDNVSVRDASSAALNPIGLANIPTESVLDADGRVIESVLPPGDIAYKSFGAGGAWDAGEPTVTAYDLAGRPVSVSLNQSTRYSSRILSDGQTNGLAAYWPLDERAGMTANDVAGAKPLTYTNTPTLATAGAVDDGRTGVSFDGASEFAVRSSAVTAAVDNFSMEAWIRVGALPAPGQYAVIAYNGTDAAGWGLAINSAGSVFGLYGSVLWFDSGYSVPPGTWHQVGLTRTNGVSQLYVDGVARGATVTAAPIVPGANFSIGAETGVGRYFDGTVDDVSVYATALTGPAISAHFGAGRPTDSATSLTSRTTYDGLGRPVDSYDPLLVRTTTAFDRLNRVVATTANYVDGSPSGSTGSDDVTSTFAYDALGELTGYCPAKQVQAAACNPATASSPTAWHYGYDKMGRIVSQVPPVNVLAGSTATNSKSWVFDVEGRVTSQCDFAAGGSCTTSTNRHTDYTYDNVGRELAQKVYAGPGTTGNLRLSWTKTYNLDSTQSSVAFDGTGSTPNEGTDTLSFTYDPLGRPYQMLRSGAVLTSYSWAPDGTLTSRTDGTAGTSTFTYDWAQRLATASSPVYSGTIAFNWLLDGLIGSRTWTGTAGQAWFTYDAAKRPISFDKNGNYTGLWQDYDRQGNVVLEGRNVGSTPTPGITGDYDQTFTYDALRRVSSASLNGVASSYTYDLDGNRVSRVEGGVRTDYVYDRTDELNQQTRDPLGTPVTRSYSYDPNGNMTLAANASSSTIAYGYDIGDRLVTLTPSGSAATTFALDALGRSRTRTTPTGGADTYEFVGLTEVVWRVTNVNGPTTTVTTSALDSAGDRTATKTGTVQDWLIPDLHGNVAATYSANEATITNSIRYGAWGQTLQAYNGNSGATDLAWKFQGRLDVSPNADSLYDAGARFYDPNIGTFTQMDTVTGNAQNPLSMNRFLYAAANPWSMIDPDGHTFCTASNYPDCDGFAPNGWRPPEPNSSGSPDDRDEKNKDKPKPSAKNTPDPLAADPTKKPTIEQISVMSIGELRVFLGEYGPANFTSYDYMFGFCLLQGGESNSCWESVRPREWGDLDGPLGTFVVAPLTALTLGATARYIASHPDEAPAIAQVITNRANGLRFQGSVLNALKTTENFIKFAARPDAANAPNELINIRPDSLLRGILEVKNLTGVLYQTPQLRAMSEAASRAGVNFNLVVSATTKVDPVVQRLVTSTGGSGYVFDEATGVFTKLFGTGPPMP
jgi:RHS repeat-associated protein